jgi:hypothetical protein
MPTHKSAYFYIDVQRNDVIDKKWVSFQYKSIVDFYLLQKQQ